MVDAPEIVEIKAKPSKKQQYQQKLLDVFSSELAVLLKERKDNEQDLTVRPMEIPPSFDSNYFEDCVVQDEDYIEGQMLKRLQSQGIRMSRWQIRDYLKAMSQQARESGSSYSALSYAPIKKKAGRKRLPKKGKKRPYNFQGTEYRSIRQAANANPDKTNYNTLKSQAYRELQRENSV